MMMSMIKNIAVLSAALLLVACVEEGADEYYPATGYSNSQTSPDSVTLQLRNDRGRYHQPRYREDGYRSTRSERSRGHAVQEKNRDIFQGNRHEAQSSSSVSMPTNVAKPTEMPSGYNASPSAPVSAPMPMEIVKPGEAPSPAPIQQPVTPPSSGYGTSPSVSGASDSSGFNTN